MKAGVVRIIVGRFKFPHERQLLVQVAQLPEQLAIANSSWETFKSSMILANLRETFSYYFGEGETGSEDVLQESSLHTQW